MVNLRSKLRDTFNKNDEIIPLIHFGVKNVDFVYHAGDDCVNVYNQHDENIHQIEVSDIKKLIKNFSNFISLLEE